MALADEVDQHGIEVREPPTGQPCAIEQGVDPTAYGVDRGGDGIGFLQVRGVIAGHLDRRFLEVDHVDFGTERFELADHGRPHAGPSPTTDHGPASFVRVQ